MNLSDLALGDNIVVHPTLLRRTRSSQACLEFVVEIKNHQELSIACGISGFLEVFAAALARLQNRLASGGVVEPEAGGRLRAFVWDINLLGEERVDDWLGALVADLMLEPVMTQFGPVHLDVALKKASGEPKRSSQSRGSQSASDTDGQDSQGRQPYLADMALVSPVFAAIGGFSDAGSDKIDVEVCWRPVSDVRSPGAPTFFEATLGLIDANGQHMPSSHVMEAAERLGLVHILDHYIVARVINELSDSPGAVSLLVSISTRSLMDTSFWCEILARLEFGGAIPHDLIVEVRGGIACEGASRSTEILQQLSCLGCRISIGNFGMCASSLRDVIAFAPDLVTVDKQFLLSSAGGRIGSAALSHLVGLARAVGGAVIMDGVNSGEQASASRDAGVLLLRGDWCGRPRVYRSWAHRTRLVALPETL